MYKNQDDKTEMAPFQRLPFIRPYYRASYNNVVKLRYLNSLTSNRGYPCFFLQPGSIDLNSTSTSEQYAYVEFSLLALQMWMAPTELLLRK